MDGPDRDELERLAALGEEDVAVGAERRSAAFIPATPPASTSPATASSPCGARRRPPSSPNTTNSRRPTTPATPSLLDGDPPRHRLTRSGPLLATGAIRPEHREPAPRGTEHSKEPAGPLPTRQCPSITVNQLVSGGHLHALQRRDRTRAGRRRNAAESACFGCY